MSKKFITIIYLIALIIFLPLSFYLLQNNIITTLVRNIIFVVLIVSYLIGINVLANDKNKK